MTQQLGRYIAAVKNQVATTLRPRELGDLALKHSLYTERVLNYLAAESRELPTLAQPWREALRALLPALAATLRDDAGLVEALRQGLGDDADLAAASAVMHQAVARLQASADPGAAPLLQQIGRIELELQQRFFDAIARESAQVVAAADANEGLSAEQKQRLTALLRRRYPQDQTLEIGAVKAIPGGFSKQTIFIELRNTQSLPERVVLRIDKPDSPVETTVVDEFPIIEAMHATGVPVPQPLLLEADPAILGGAFVLVGRIAGSTAGDYFEIPGRTREFGITLARALAKMHAVPPENVGDKVPGARIPVRERMLNEIDQFEKKWRASGQPSLTLEIAYGWLRANIALSSSGRRAIIHRDVGGHNLLVDDGALSAILDWETALVGDPAQDLAYTWHMVTQVMPWQEFLDEYERAGGTRPSSEQINFYRVWGQLWLMTMQTQAKAAVEAGYTNDIGLIYNVLNLFQRLSVSLQALLCEVTKNPSSQG